MLLKSMINQMLEKRALALILKFPLTSSHLSTAGLSGLAALLDLLKLKSRIKSISSVSSGMVERMNTTVDTTTTPIEVNAYN